MNVATNIQSGTLYFTFQDSSGNYWNGSAFEAYNGASWTTYDVAATSEGAGVYSVSVPTDASDYQLRLQAGASPATTDAVVDAGLTSSSAPSAATIADAVWDEAQSGHVTAGTFGAYLDAAVSAGGGGITVINASDAILTSTSPTTDTDDGTVTIYAGASYTGTGEGIAKSRTWTGDSLDGATATLYVIRQDQYEDVTDVTAWTALDTATVTQTGTTIAVSFNPAYTATAALDWGTDGAGRTIYRAHVVIAASKKPLWDFALIVKRGEWA